MIAIIDRKTAAPAAYPDYLFFHMRLQAVMGRLMLRACLTLLSCRPI